MRRLPPLGAAKSSIGCRVAAGSYARCSADHEARCHRGCSHCRSCLTRQACVTAAGRCVADWPEVGELVGVDDRADAPDLTVGDAEPHTPSSRCCGSRMSAPGPWLTSTWRNDTPGMPSSPTLLNLTSICATRFRPRSGCVKAGTLPPPSPVNSTSAASSASRSASSGLLGGGEEPGRELVFARCLAAGPALVDVASGACSESAHVVLALADDLGDLRVVVFEHVVQQQHCPLLRGEALQEHQHRHRERIGHLGVQRGVIFAVGDDRLWQPFANVPFAAGAGQMELVDRQAGGHGRDERPRRRDLLAGLEGLMGPQRCLLSWTMSSASETLPSIR
jgi:hypothetical protein